MKLSVYSDFGRKPRGHKRGCRCVVCKHSKRRGRKTHRKSRGRGRKGRKSSGRRLGRAAKAASRICRGLLRRRKITKLGPCYRRELKFKLGGRKSRR